MSQILVAVDQGREHFGRYNLLRLIPQSVYLLLLLLLWWSGYISAAYCVFATWIGSLVIVIIRLPRAWRETGWRITSSRMLSLLRRGTSFHLAFLSSILLQRADQFVIVTWFDHKALGLYAVAMTASGVALGTVTGATTAILLPNLARTTGREERQRKIRTALGGTLLVSIAMNAVMAAIAPWLVPRSLVGPIRKLPPLLLFFVRCRYRWRMFPLHLLHCAPLAIGARRIAPLIGLCIFAASAPLLIPSMHTKGVALALLLGWLGAFVYIVWRVSERIELKPMACLTPSPNDMKALYISMLDRCRRFSWSRNGATASKREILMAKFVTTFNQARDYYSLPLALHEIGLLERHVTDLYVPDT